MRRTHFYVVVSVWLLTVGAVVCDADTRLQLSGAADPTSQGWTTLGPAATTGPITNDLNTGMDAWSLGYNGSGTGLFYHAPNTAWYNSTWSNGWEFTMNVRFPIIPSGGFFQFDVNVPKPFTPGGTTGNSGYDVIFQAASQGNVFVNVGGDVLANSVFPQPSFVLQNPTAYHFFQLQYDPATQSANLFVDGVAKVSNFVGLAANDNRIQWGLESTTSSGTIQGQANVSLVQFDVVPEPSAIALLAAGGIGLLISSMRCRSIA
jgi:Vibrio cholerae sialidase, lectin insertion